MAERPTVSGRLLYVVGPSGVGKDALLQWAASRLPDQGMDRGGGAAKVRFARRWITRPPQAGGEEHLPLSAEEFETRLAAGEFALAWRANGNGYGIGNDIRDWLAAGVTVVVNGSREYLPEALRRFPDLKVISISASTRTLRDRLERRARETPVQIERRLARATRFPVPPGTEVVEIRNEASPDVAGEALLKVILSG